jgi:hypothetical protein
MRRSPGGSAGEACLQAALSGRAAPSGERPGTRCGCRICSVIEVSTVSGRLRIVRLDQAVTRIAWPSIYVTHARGLARLMVDRALVGFGDLLRRRELAGSDAKGLGQRPHGAR